MNCLAYKSNPLIIHKISYVRIHHALGKGLRTSTWYLGKHNASSQTILHRENARSCSRYNPSCLLKLQQMKTFNELKIEKNSHRTTVSAQCRYFSITPLYNTQDHQPSSQVEKSVQAIKDKAKSAAESADTPSKIVPKKSLMIRIKEELLHYYHGFKLLFIDTRLCSRYVWRLLKGEALSRREHRQLIRTTGDLFRLVPFSVFIIVPFMEFLLPVALKIFPGMLPSTFETANERDAKMKKKLKVKLEMVKFLQETLDTMALVSKGDHSSQSAKDFVEFFEKVHNTGVCVDNEEILKFSKLFEDEITLDSLGRPQLIALCRLLEMQAIGTTNLLRFQLRTKLRQLAADDRIIRQEGLDKLTVWELQLACKARGMRSVGVSEERMRLQMKQWLELSLDKKVPPSLLLLSRTLYLPENVPPEATLAATISTLPEEVATRTKASIGKKEGKIENITKLEIIKNEEKKIELDRKEMEEEKVKKAQKATAQKAAEVAIGTEALKDAIADVKHDELREAMETLVDKAPDIQDETLQVKIDEAKEDIDKIVKEAEVTPEDIDRIEEALEMVGEQKKKLYIQQSGLSEVKSEISDYEEDLKDLEEVIAETGGDKSVLRESKAARRLYGKVNKLVSRLDTLLNAIDKQKETLQNQIEMQPDNKESGDTVAIEELIQQLQSIVSIEDQEKVKIVRKVLDKLDTDQDGAIKAEHVIKVLELLSEDQQGMSSKMIEEVVEMMSKEEQLGVQSLVKETFSLPSVKNKFSISQLEFTDKGYLKSLDATKDHEIESKVKNLKSSETSDSNTQPKHQ